MFRALQPSEAAGSGGVLASRAHRLRHRFCDITNKHRLEPCRSVTKKGEDG
jgi:hypothetical protein